MAEDVEDKGEDADLAGAESQTGSARKPPQIHVMDGKHPLQVVLHGARHAGIDRFYFELDAEGAPVLVAARNVLENDRGPADPAWVEAALAIARGHQGEPPAGPFLFHIRTSRREDGRRAPEAVPEKGEAEDAALPAHDWG
ncbi:MAG: hypothetical protein DI629_20390 [Mesorhizobium amorphae]|nr:MAG: hypothetical protein DI629_20390 [Mesorhizobium amorphae]